MIQDLRKEAYFGENTPLVPDEHGDYTRPVNFRKRYYRILAAAGIEKKGLHSLRHTFASNLVNGISRYLLNRKMSEAKRLLQETNEKILDIAYRLGYEDISHFNRAFRNSVGCSPSHFRRISK